MLEKVADFFGIAALYLAAVVLLWVLLIVSGYALTRWCVKYSIAWSSVVKWITGAMLIVFVSTVTLSLLPPHLAVPITKVIIPSLVCAAALHALLLSTDRYMRHKYGEGIMPTRLVVAIILVYTMMILGSVGLIKLDYLPVMKLFAITIGYLTRISIIGLLVLEIWSGRCKEQKDDDNSSISSSGYSGGRW